MSTNTKPKAAQTPHHASDAKPHKVRNLCDITCLCGQDQQRLATWQAFPPHNHSFLSHFVPGCYNTHPDVVHLLPRRACSR